MNTKLILELELDADLQPRIKIYGNPKRLKFLAEALLELAEDLQESARRSG